MYGALCPNEECRRPTIQFGPSTNSRHPARTDFRDDELEEMERSRITIYPGKTASRSRTKELLDKAAVSATGSATGQLIAGAVRAFTGG